MRGRCLVPARKRLWAVAAEAARVLCREARIGIRPLVFFTIRLLKMMFSWFRFYRIACYWCYVISILVCWLAGRRDDGRQEFPRKALSECSITPGEQFFEFPTNKREI